MQAGAIQETLVKSGYETVSKAPWTQGDGFDTLTPVRGVPREMLPGFTPTDSDEHRRFVSDLISDVKKDFGDSLITGDHADPDHLISAIPGGFVTLPGFPMEPYGVPESPDLDKAFLDVDEEFLKYLGWLCDMVNESYEPREMRIKKQSRTGFPLNARFPGSKGDASIARFLAYKQTLSDKIMNEADRYLGLVDQERWQDLADDYHSPFVYFTVNRYQVDSVEYTFEGDKLIDAKAKARNGFAFPGDAVEFEKYVSKHPESWSFIRERERIAYGPSLGMSIIAKAYVTAHEQSFLKSYSGFFKMRTPQDITDYFSGYESLEFGDVKQFDTNQKSNIMFFIASKLANGNDAFQKYLETLFMAPSITTNGLRGSKSRYIIHGNILDPYSDRFAVGARGKASGDPTVSLQNRIVGGALVAYLIAKSQGKPWKVNEFRDFFKRGTRDVRAKGSGDDFVVAFKTLAQAQAFVKAYEKSPIPVERQTPGVYLGLMPFQNGTFRSWIPNIGTWMNKLLCNEKSWGMRPNPYLGLVLQREYYRTVAGVPEMEALFDSLFEVFNFHLKRSYNVDLQALLLHPPELQMSLGTMSMADRMILMSDNIDYIHYRYDESEVSDKILNDYFIHVSADEVARVNNLIKGVASNG